MQRLVLAACAAIAMVLATWTALAQSPIELKAGAGRDLVTGYCSQCHSLDYIQGNSPFMNRQTWEAEVQKMIKAYGAQVPADEVPKIVDYLAAQYGAPSK